MGPGWALRSGKRTGLGVESPRWGWGVGVPGVRCRSKYPLSSPPGVLLDIQQHFGVKDQGAGLLQSGEAHLRCQVLALPAGSLPGADSLCIQIPLLPLTSHPFSSLCFSS